ncbi:50S ribosomal protein L3 [Candidatus Woesearchaeota archaeon]|nr:50S ribosomal protein L3 [Candidatus Woesearchaeota archaeon]
MPKTKNPRHGSLAYWPRKRAKKEIPRIRPVSVAKGAKGAKVNGFPGYKVGMATVEFIDNKKKSPSANELIAKPATILECPPVKIFSVRYYKNTPYGIKLMTEALNPKLDKSLARKITMPKKKKQIDENLDTFDLLRIAVYTQPSLTNIGKKKPEIFELALGGSKEEQLAFAKEHLDKEINVKEVFAAGQLVDAHAVSKGKGFQGAVKRYGVSLRSHKSEKSRRAAILGAEGDAKVTYLAHQPGKMGYHLRTEHNKWLLKIVDDIASLGHFKHYGNLKNTCLLVKGTIPGPAKRMVLFTMAKRPDKRVPTQAPEIRNIQ